MINPQDNSVRFPSSASFSLLRSKRPGLASFTVSSPPLGPWAGFLPHISASWGKCKHQATLGTHQCHFSITHQGLFQRCRQPQTPAKIRVLPLSHALCPAQGRINQEIGYCHMLQWLCHPWMVVGKAVGWDVSPRTLIIDWWCYFR